MNLISYFVAFLKGAGYGNFMTTWNFFTNYGHIIILLGENSKLTLREIALRVGITERATQKIISDLEKDGFLKINKVGRQNSYKVVSRKKLRHDIEKNCRVEDLLQLADES